MEWADKGFMDKRVATRIKGGAKNGQSSYVGNKGAERRFMDEKLVEEDTEDQRVG